MAKFCSNCGASLNDGARFCNDCGAQTESPAQEQPQQAQPVGQPQAQPYIQPQAGAVSKPVAAVAPSATGAKPMSAVKYVGYIFLMSLPFAGLVFSILLGAKKEPTDRRSLARAMILFSIISIIICMAMGFMLFIYTQVVADLHFKLFGIKLF